MGNEMRKFDRARFIWFLAASLCFSALYPRLSFVEGVYRVVECHNIQGETAADNILTVSSGSIKIGFAFLDLNN